MRAYSSGYTLIEVLIAVLVLSIGLSALGIMQVLTVKNTYNANNRAFAVMTAESMADLIRSNLTAYEFGAFTNQTGGISAADCSGGCNAMQMAQSDVMLWRLQLARLLPEGQGVLCMDGSDGSINDGEPGNEMCSGLGQNVIKVFWRETISADNAAVNAQSNGWSAFGTPVYP